MAEAGTNVQGWFNWEEHFLDVLLIFWISLGLVVVGLSNSLNQFFGPLKSQSRPGWDKTKDVGSTKSSGSVQPHQPESAFWLNSALNWAFLHYNYVPEFVDAWIHSLNEQVTKLGGPVQIKFEKVEPGSLPPKFGDVTFDSGPEDVYVVECIVDSRDLSLGVFASQQTHEGVKLTNLIVSVLKLKGHLRIRCFRNGKDMMAEASFHGRPTVQVSCKPVNEYTEPSDMVDVGVVEEVVRNTICLSSTTFNISQWINGHGHTERPPAGHYSPYEAPPSPSALVVPGFAPSVQEVTHAAPTPMAPTPIAHSQKKPAPLAPVEPPKAEVFEAIQVQEAQQQHSAFHVPTLASSPTRLQQKPVYPDQSDKRLLVKVIKASGLKQNDGAVDPYCIAYVDTPPQSEVTSVVRNSFNPFWDEQFYFDLTKDSGELRFEILDKKRPPNDNFLGEAAVDVQDLKHNPSSRQIILLQGRLGAGEFISGSVTVEFLCTDQSEETVSPRRTIETSKSVTPGGTLVTTTTTTTQKPQNHRYDTTIDGSPSYIEKKGFDYNTTDTEGGSSAFYRPSSAETVKPRSKTLESSPTEEDILPKSTSSTMSSPEVTYSQPKEKKSLAARIRKRFSRSKKRSQSADGRATSLREGSGYLRPPGPQSKDDIDLHKQKPADVPNLKKSKSLGGSLKKLFRRSRKRSRSMGRGEQSRESSVSRHSRHASMDPSREGSLTRSSYTPSQQQDTVIL